MDWPKDRLLLAASCLLAGCAPVVFPASSGDDPVGPPPVAIDDTARYRSFQRTLTGGQGVLYVLGNTIFIEAPDKTRRALYSLLDCTTVVDAARDGSYVLIHEPCRYLGHLTQLVPTPVPTVDLTVPDLGSRLVYQPLSGAGDRQVLVEHFYQYTMDVVPAPDGHTWALRTFPSLDAKLPGLYTVDVTHPTLVPVLSNHRIDSFGWSPDGQQLAVLGADSAQSPTRLYLISGTHEAIRATFPAVAGSQLPTWVGNGQAVFTLTYTPDLTSADAALYRLDGTTDRFTATLGGQPFQLYDPKVSYDGTRVLAAAISEAHPFNCLLDIPHHRLVQLPDSDLNPSWDGNTLVCTSADGQATSTCEVPQ